MQLFIYIDTNMWISDDTDTTTQVPSLEACGLISSTVLPTHSQMTLVQYVSAIGNNNIEADADGARCGVTVRHIINMIVE